MKEKTADMKDQYGSKINIIFLVSVALTICAEAF